MVERQQLLGALTPELFRRHTRSGLAQCGAPREQQG